MTVMLVFSSRSGLCLCLPILGPSDGIVLVSNLGLASDYGLNWVEVLLNDQLDLYRPGESVAGTASTSECH